MKVFLTGKGNSTYFGKNREYRYCFYFPYVSSYPGTGAVWRESFMCTKDECSNNICSLPGLYLLWRWNASSLPL